MTEIEESVKHAARIIIQKSDDVIWGDKAMTEQVAIECFYFFCSVFDIGSKELAEKILNYAKKVKP